MSVNPRFQETSVRTRMQKIVGFRSSLWVVIEVNLRSIKKTYSCFNPSRVKRLRLDKVGSAEGIGNAKSDSRV